MNQKELELYIHIPFCVKKCSYCDFLSAPATEQTMETYMAALFAEIRGRAEDCTDRMVTSVFIGGGTPSLLSGESIRQLMECIRESYTLAEDTEKKGTVKVWFPNTVGVPDEFSQVESIILDIIPCHLLVEFYFRYLTWLECEAQKFTWQSVEDAHHTWESFEKAVPEEE